MLVAALLLVTRSEKQWPLLVWFRKPQEAADFVLRSYGATEPYHPATCHSEVDTVTTSSYRDSPPPHCFYVSLLVAHLSSSAHAVNGSVLQYDTLISELGTVVLESSFSAVNVTLASGQGRT